MKKIAIVSTKGGVGKTTATAQIALAFHRAGFKVGALDLDSSSPTLHLAFGLAEAPPWGLDTENSRILPSKLANGIELATMASFWGANNRVSWRGTDKGDLTRQMLSGMVGWSPGLDFLCIDSPPSMSEEIFVLAADKSITGYVIITQPQPMSIADIERLTNFCRAERLPVFGIVPISTAASCRTATCTILSSAATSMLSSGPRRTRYRSFARYRRSLIPSTSKSSIRHLPGGWRPVPRSSSPTGRG